MVRNGIHSNLRVYMQNDYRRFFLAHVKYLTGLCKLSLEIVNDSIDQLLLSLFLTNQLYKESQLDEHISSRIMENYARLPSEFNRLLFLIRSVNHGNSIVSTFGTNFEYLTQLDQLVLLYAQTSPITYDGECSCGIYPHCTTTAEFFGNQSNSNISVKGLKIGCTPTESLRTSNLECFYDSTCLNILLNHINTTSTLNSLTILNNTQSRFAKNATVAELVNQLFIERWITSKDYYTYFNKCSPLSCYYSYTQKFNLLYTVTILLGLQGGLGVVLKWLCPKLVRLLVHILKSLKKSSTVKPEQINNESSIDFNDSTDRKDISAAEFGSMNLTLEYVLFHLN